MKNNKDKIINESFFKFFKNSTFFVVFGLLVFGFLIGVVSSRYSIFKCRSSFKFINVSVVCGKSDVIKKTDYTKIQNEIEKYIQDEKSAGRLTEAAVYFRDLKNGPVFGVNETIDFAPASLLKLPLALVYLTQAERDPKILEEQLRGEKPDWSFTENFHPTETINPTEPHTVDDLLRHMLSYSDNNSYGVLQKNIYDTGQKGVMNQTFLELGFIDPTSVYDEVISVRQYASIFRVLYNASYLSDDLSEKVLAWLVQADFTQGLVSGVPEGVKIAHKFGERTSPDGEKQLHDCGIVYYPKNPYLLCVMTHGQDFTEIKAVISHISEEVYQEVNSRRI